MDITERIHNAIEWANKRLTLQGQELSQEQKNYLTFALSQNFIDNYQALQLLQPDVSSSLCVCGSSEINKKLIEQGTWLGSSSSSMRKYSRNDERFKTREYSLGFDFYAKTDLLKTNCRQCGKSDFVAV